MSFKVIDRNTNRKLVYELLLVEYSSLTFTIITISETQAVLMLKTTFLPAPLVFDNITILQSFSHVCPHFMLGFAKTVWR